MLNSLLSGNSLVHVRHCTGVNTPNNKKTNQLRMPLILHPTNFGFSSELRVPDKDDVKQKTSLFSVQGKICLVLFGIV